MLGDGLHNIFSVDVQGAVEVIVALLFFCCALLKVQFLVYQFSSMILCLEVICTRDK